MKLPPLQQGRLLRRYKRFLADVEFEDGAVVTAHCPNTGSMATCWQPGARVQVSHADNPARKLEWTLERIDMGAGWIGVHTGRTNAIIAEGLEQGRIEGLNGYSRLRREVRIDGAGGERARLDILLSQGLLADAYVEVKNVTLLDGDRLLFPDSVSERARKHLNVLDHLVGQGHRGVILFALNRPEGRFFSPATAIDPDYAATLLEVSRRGVEVVAVRIAHSSDGMSVGEQVPVELSS